MPVIQRIRYLAFKWEALALLVFGQRRRQLPSSTGCWPNFRVMLTRWRARLTCWFRPGDRGQALQLLQALVQDEPGSAHHWFNYGFML